jgi:hypothetical protein
MWLKLSFFQLCHQDVQTIGPAGHRAVQPNGRPGYAWNDGLSSFFVFLFFGVAPFVNPWFSVMYILGVCM